MPTRYGKWGLAGIVAGVLGVVAVAFTAVSWPSGRPGTSVAEAQEFLARIPDRLVLADGQVLHTRTQVYERYGPKAQEIAVGTGIPTERHVVESWQQAGPDNSLALSFARIVAEGGQVVRESLIASGTIRTIDPLTRTVLSQDQLLLEGGLVKMNAERARADRYNAALAAGQARILNQTDKELTLEMSHSGDCLLRLPPEVREAFEGQATSPCKDSLADFGPGEWKVPFYADLDVHTLVSVVTIRNDGIVLRSEVYVASESGGRTLIQSTTTEAEVLEEMPSFTEP